MKSVTKPRLKGKFCVHEVIFYTCLYEGIYRAITHFYIAPSWHTDMKLDTHKRNIKLSNTCRAYSILIVKQLYKKRSFHKKTIFLRSNFILGNFKWLWYIHGSTLSNFYFLNWVASCVRLNILNLFNYILHVQKK